MSESIFRGRDVIVLGERDGIAGPPLADIVRSMGGNVVLVETECFV
jgi:glycine/sarcosine/betaine reductase complex component A